jgi:hypothetical protein
VTIKALAKLSDDAVRCGVNQHAMDDLTGKIEDRREGNRIIRAGDPRVFRCLRCRSLRFEVWDSQGRLIPGTRYYVYPDSYKPHGKIGSKRYTRKELFRQEYQARGL